MSNILDSFLSKDARLKDNLPFSDDTATANNDDVASGFTFGKATNFAGKFGERPGKRAALSFDAAPPVNKEPAISPALPNFQPASSSSHTADHALPSTPILPPKLPEPPCINARENAAHAANTASVAVEKPTQPPVTRAPFEAGRPTGVHCVPEAGAPFSGTRLAHVSAKRHHSASTAKSQAFDKMLRTPTMAPSFIVAPPTHTTNGEMSPRCSSMTPSVVGDLETTHIHKPKPLNLPHSRNTVDVSKRQQVKRQHVTSHAINKENNEPFGARPSSRASNISRRRLQIPKNWFSKSEDQKQLQNVALTLNAWAEHNDYRRTKVQEVLDGLEQKVHHLEGELEKKNLTLDEFEAQISDLETEKGFIEEQNSDLSKDRARLEEELTKKMASVEESEKKAADIQEQLVEMLHHFGISDKITDAAEVCSRVCEVFDSTGTSLAEHEVALAKAERAREVAQSSIEQMTKEMSCMKINHDKRTQDMEANLKEKDAEILSRQSQISELTQKIHDDEVLRQQNERLEQQLSNITASLANFSTKAETEAPLRQELEAKLELILNSVQDRSADTDRESYLQGYLAKIEDLCSRTENNILSSLSVVVGEGSDDRHLQIENRLQTLLQDQVEAITQKVSEYEARVCEASTKSSAEEKLADHLKELQTALTEARNRYQAAEKELVIKSCSLDSALEKANEASELKSENTALRDSVTSLSNEKMSVASEKNKSIEDLQYRIIECQSRQNELERELRDGEMLRVELKSALDAEKKKLLAAEETLAKAEKTPDPKDSVLAGLGGSSDEGKRLAQQLFESNQRVINLKEKLKKYEGLLVEAHETIKKWETHSRSIVGLQNKLSGVGFSNITAMCRRLEGFVEKKVAPSSQEVSGSTGVQVPPPRRSCSLPAAEITFDESDDNLFTEIDIQELLDDMDGVRSPKPAVADDSKVPEDAAPKDVTNVDLARDLEKMRRIVIKSPCETDPPIAPTVEEEKALRRSAMPPTSIMKTRSLDKIPGKPSDKPESSQDATRTRQMQLRKSYRRQYTRPVMSSTQTATSMTSEFGISTADEIRQSLTISKMPAPGGSDIRCAKRVLDGVHDDGASVKAAKTEGISSPSGMSGIRSGYFSHRAQSEN